jgi:TrpR family transcriptional regulator, trp operon repressor
MERPQTREESIAELAVALARTEDPQLVAAFLGSLLTENELREVADRWALVRLMDEGLSQRKIAERLGLSLCKITRGSRELKRCNSPFKHMIRMYRESLDRPVSESDR